MPETRGFLFDHGMFTDVDIPGAAFAQLDVINNAGVAVGGYTVAPFSLSTEQFLTRPFFVRNPDGAIHLLPPIAPGAGFYQGYVGLNDEGTIVGTFTLTPEIMAWPFGLQGFILKDGKYQIYNYPGATQTALSTINNRGTILGWWQGDSAEQHGFLLHKDGTVVPVEVPGSSSTNPFGINTKGDVVGNYLDAAQGLHGFLLSNGIYTTLDYPGTSGTTFVVGINDQGEMVGGYFDAIGAQHGFIATP